MYRDANNLYGWAMIQDLPHSDFKWLSNKKINEFDLNISENSPIGYILECDLRYSKKLHDSHSDYPLCIKKKLKLVIICCQNIVVTLLINIK